MWVCAYFWFLKGSQHASAKGLTEIEAAFQRFGLRSPGQDESEEKTDAEESLVEEPPPVPTMEPFSSTFMIGQFLCELLSKTYKNTSHYYVYRSWMTKIGSTCCKKHILLLIPYVNNNCVIQAKTNRWKPKVIHHYYLCRCHR